MAERVHASPLRPGRAELQLGSHAPPSASSPGHSLGLFFSAIACHTARLPSPESGHYVLGMAKLWMVSAFLVLSMLACADDTNSVPPPAFRAPDDKSEYRRLVLENGLRVLLCSDPNLVSASAAVAVDAGYYDDPVSRPGLAHYVEHLLFLGSEKYPGDSDFTRTVTAHGGDFSAETKSDHTIFAFKAPTDAFESSLDRMAQFFIAPRFDLTAAERELTAIENEVERHRDDDAVRRQFVSLELHDPSSPESHFPIGNRSTLAGTTRDEVVAFYQSRYSADHMALALRGPMPCEQLEKLARSCFSAVPRRPVAARPAGPGTNTAQATGRFVQIASSGDQSMLFLEFPIGAARSQILSKPAELVAAVLTAPGSGSLIEHFRSEGLALWCEASVEHHSEERSSLVLPITLTAAGRARPERVLQLVFARCERLHTAPFPTDSFNEQSFLAAKQEAFGTGSAPQKGIMTLAANALLHPLELAERVPFLWEQLDEDAYRKVLASLRPANALVSLVAPDVATDRKERYYGFAYSCTDLANEGPRSPAPSPADIAASLPPEPNPFIDGTIRLLGEHPIRVVDEPGLTLHHLEVDKPRRPLVAYHFVIHPGTGSLDQREFCRLLLYQGVLKSRFPAHDQALAAAITVGLSFTADGLVVSVSGFSGGTERFLEQLFARMAHPALEAGAFQELREHIENMAQDAGRAEALDLVQMRFAGIINTPGVIVSELAATARQITREEVLAVPRTLFRRCHIEAIACGNVDADEAARLARMLRDQLHARPAAPHKVVRSRFLQLPAGETVVDAATVPGTNSAARLAYVTGEDTPELRAALAIAGAFLEGDFYADLRTRQQLGYRVGSGVIGERHFLGLVGQAQSADHASDTLRARIEAYFAELPRRWAAVTPEQFAAFRSAARFALENGPTDLAPQAENYWDLAYRDGRDWNRDAKILAALDSLTQERVSQILAELVAPATRRLVVVQLTAKDHQLKEAPVPTFTDREAWKKTQTYR